MRKVFPVFIVLGIMLSSCAQEQRGWIIPPPPINPAKNSCLNQGFKDGSEAMAICMASYLEREQQARAQQAQQQQYERTRKDQAWQRVSESMARSRGENQRITCSTYGSTTDCTTY